MIVGVLCGVERHKHIGHDAASAIDGAVQTQGGMFQRVGEMDAVSALQLAVVVAVDDVLVVVLTVAFDIRLLDVASRRGVIACDCEAER